MLERFFGKSNHWQRWGVSLVLGSLLAAMPAMSTGEAMVRAEGAIAQKMERLKNTDKKWLEIDLIRQRLIAWEGNQPVYAVVVSTGKASTPTPPGIFAIQSKHRYARMQGANYDISKVPYTMYYYGGYAIHGAFWHNRFGTPVSHGCTNVAVDRAQWFFEWASVGTPVIVHDERDW